MARIRPVSLLILAPVLVVLGIGAFVFYGALEAQRFVERARQERLMRSAAFNVVDELGAELFTMYSAFSYDLMVRRDNGTPVDRQVLSDAVFRYRAQARFPELLDSLACLVRRGGAYEYAAWTEKGWLVGVRPDWAVDLKPPQGPSSQSAQAFSLEKPVLTLFLRGSRGEGEVVAVALRFSASVVLEQVLPNLIRQQFPEAPAVAPYRAEFHNRGLPRTSAPRPVDWEVPLLPTTSFDSWFEYYINRLKTLDRSRLAFERVQTTEPDEGRGWYLSVTRQPNGLAQEMMVSQAANVAWALGFYLVLSLGFIALYRVANKAGIRAREERTFLALVSHELKTPVAVVRSLAENLSRGVGTTEARAREYGEVLLEESDRLNRMVGNVLALTAIQGGVLELDLAPVDLGFIIRERLAREPARPDVEVSLAAHPGLPPAWGHAQTLTAAVDNLIGNAFRHGIVGPGPHRIHLIVEPRRRGRRHGVLFSISDNGPGFSWVEARSLFRPFRRGRRARAEQVPGGGMGLTLVKAAARAMGGTLDWRSRPGEGARFLLWLREAP